MINFYKLNQSALAHAIKAQTGTLKPCNAGARLHRAPNLSTKTASP